jgi:hypothetical protein
MAIAALPMHFNVMAGQLYVSWSGPLQPERFYIRQEGWITAPCPSLPACQKHMELTQRRELQCDRRLDEKSLHWHAAALQIDQVPAAIKHPAEITHKAEVLAPYPRQLRQGGSANL